MQTGKINIFWFRRDLRTEDNAGLFHALNAGLPVLPVFIFDTDILNQLNPDDARVSFIYDRLAKLRKAFEENGSSLKVFHGKPLEFFQQIISEYSVSAVYTNRDYEPTACERDQAVKEFLEKKEIHFFDFKDQVIFDHDEIVKEDGKPYTVFTPYSRKWKAALSDAALNGFSSQNLLHNLLKTKPFEIISLEKMGFEVTTYAVPEFDISEEKLSTYARLRDFPAENGTSRLSVHLRFGTVSIRKVTRIALQYSEIFLNELIWRNFYMDILWHFPKVEKQSFKPEYDRIVWRNNEAEFNKWCCGETGYPLVDAGMRELNETGYMHNRVRMVTASFLTKHLLVDWRWGEAYFAEKLVDYDLAANNGAWQWAAGCGCDAAAYFRVFNPALQNQKFDPENKYIRKWVPEFGTNQYSEPIVDHTFARNRAIETYKRYLQSE
ncbi:MAG TPA: deoxyribodipyrimidine photolyase [Prolixibacteraceae bacterium]|nr:deoxyribodipyrimidine photolyase [Prolixibacteraceae bacterium]